MSEKLFRQPGIATDFAATMGNRLTAAELRIWGLAIVGVAYWADIIRGANEHSGSVVGSAVDGVIANGVFNACAWAMILTRTWAGSDRAPARVRDIIATVAAGVAVIAPVRLALSLGLAILGSTLYSDSRLPHEARRMRLVFLALAIETLSTTALAAPLHVAAGALDASATSFLLNQFGQTASHHGDFIENLSSGTGIAVWPLCASTFPLPGVCLAFLLTLLYFRQRLRKSQLAWLVASCLASVLLTEARLTLMAWSNDDFHWWHDGPGVTVYVLAALSLAVLFPLLAMVRLRRPDNHMTTRLAT
jgi:hypothetical protein